MSTWGGARCGWRGGPARAPAWRRTRAMRAVIPEAMADEQHWGPVHAAEVRLDFGERTAGGRGVWARGGAASARGGAMESAFESGGGNTTKERRF